jgi:hypothetical protein
LIAAKAPEDWREELERTGLMEISGAIYWSRADTGGDCGERRTSNLDIFSMLDIQI